MLDASQAAVVSARPHPAHTVTALPAPAHSAPAGPDALIAAARTLLPVLEAGRPLDAATIRTAMTRAFGASDAEGAWIWKDAYEAAEAAVVLFVQRYGRAIRRQAGAGTDGPQRMLAMLAAIAALEPSHTKRPRTRSASSSSRRPCRWPMPRSAPPPSARAMSCSNPPPAPACWPSWPSARSATGPPAHFI